MRVHKHGVESEGLQVVYPREEDEETLYLSSKICFTVRPTFGPIAVLVAVLIAVFVALLLLIVMKKELENRQYPPSIPSADLKALANLALNFPV